MTRRRETAPQSAAHLQTDKGTDGLADSNNSSPVRSRILHILLIVWMIAVLALHWIAQGSPGAPAIAEFVSPLRDLIQGFFSAPFQG